MCDDELKVEERSTPELSQLLTHYKAERPCPGANHRLRHDSPWQVVRATAGVYCSSSALTGGVTATVDVEALGETWLALALSAIREERRVRACQGSWRSGGQCKTLAQRFLLAAGQRHRLACVGKHISRRLVAARRLGHLAKLHKMQALGSIHASLQKMEQTDTEDNNSCKPRTRPAAKSSNHQLACWYLRRKASRCLLRSLVATRVATPAMMRYVSACACACTQFSHF